MRPYIRRAAVTACLALLGVVQGCGGGGSSSASQEGPASTATYAASKGVAEKGPLILGSVVTAQELDALLAPNGKQYSYQVNSDLGTFTPNSTFTSPYLSLNATGYYFDEVTGAVSQGTVTLNGIADLSSSSVVNVNLLTTLAYQRIQNLVKNSGMSIAAATAQAEREVLAALNIHDASPISDFSTLDISKGREGDKALAAISSLFVQGNTPGNLSALIANFQADLGANGKLTSSSIASTLAASAKAIDPASVASNLNDKYSGSGATFAATDISNWIDRDGDGLIGRLEFSVPNATPASTFALPAEVTAPYAGLQVSVSNAQLIVNGVPVASPFTLRPGDAVALAPPAGTFPGGVLTAYLTSGSTRIARVSFVAALSSITIEPAAASAPVGMSRQFRAMGSFTDGSTADLTSSVTWATSAPAIAGIDQQSGLAQGAAVGTARITASSGGVSGSATLDVTDAILVSMSLAPAPMETGVGIARTIKATGTLSDGSTSDVSAKAVWTTGDPSIATVSGGVVTGVALGTTQISAAVGAVSSAAVVSVAAIVWQVATFNVGDASPQCVAVSDIDANGTLDLVVANWGFQRISVLPGSGTGTFGPYENFVADADPSCLALADFNRDGKPDTVVSDRNGANVSVLLGNGDRSFGSPVDYAVGTNPTALATGDLNGDGAIDLVVANYYTSDISVLLGTGSGTLTPERRIATGPSPRSIAIGDFNADGHPDIAVANQLGNTISVLLGDGTGTFQNVGDVPVAGPASLSAADFDGDGYLDLAVAGIDSDEVYVLRGDGTGAFSAPLALAVGDGPISLVVVDLNRDGLLDIAVANYFGNTVSVLFGKGAGRFDSALSFAVGGGPRSLAVGDFNSDGRPDLVTAGDSRSVSVLLNQ